MNETTSFSKEQLDDMKAQEAAAKAEQSAIEATKPIVDPTPAEIELAARSLRAKEAWADFQADQPKPVEDAQEEFRNIHELAKQPVKVKDESKPVEDAQEPEWTVEGLAKELDIDYPTTGNPQEGDTVAHINSITAQALSMTHPAARFCPGTGHDRDTLQQARAEFLAEVDTWESELTGTAKSRTPQQQEAVEIIWLNTQRLCLAHLKENAVRRENSIPTVRIPKLAAQARAIRLYVEPDKYRPGLRKTAEQKAAAFEKAFPHQSIHHALMANTTR